MTAFSERQRAELRDAAARSRLEALDESRRLAESSRVPSREQAARASTRAAEARADVDEVLALPEAQEIIRRLGAAVDPDYPHRQEHVAMVAAVVVKAKMQPTNAYAKATLP